MKIIVILFSFIFPLTLLACENWFNNLKIKDSKNCLSLCRTSQTDMSSYSCTKSCDILCKKNDKNSEKEPNFYDLTDDEIKFCKKEPVKCSKAYALGYLAENQCLKIFVVSDHNDESDACRHYIWSYYLSKDFGEKEAREILNAHENNPNQDPKEKEMDLHNNEVALKDYKNKLDLPDKIEKVISKFEENLKNKKFKVIKSTKPIQAKGDNL